MSSTVPYIGSKISLVSNSDIRYEGILYTINTQESTIALQSVRCCGTEGRKIPEIPPSSEIYDFIIFRGQDIKDLTVLESANPALSAQLNDPAIMSVNQRPAGGNVGDKGTTSGGTNRTASGGGYNSGGKSSSKGTTRSTNYGSNDNSGWGGWGSGWQKQDSRFNDYSYGGGGGGGGYGGWKKSDSHTSGKGGGGQKSADTSKGGKSAGKGGKSTKGGKSSPKGGSGSDRTGKGAGASGGGGHRSGHPGGMGARRAGGGDALSGTPVGELLPQVNEDVKKEYAEEFDYTAENGKCDKVMKVEGDEIDDKLKPLSGYDKTTSFFDNISCEATERAGEAERPKVDRNKARQNDRETFGDTRRPSRPAGGHRGKGSWRGGPRSYRP